MTRVPDLPAIHHINNVIMVGPEIFKFVFKPTVICGEKGVPTGESLATAWIVCYM